MISLVSAAFENGGGGAGGFGGFDFSGADMGDIFGDIFGDLFEAAEAADVPIMDL